jgi:hypothetical protein
LLGKAVYEVAVNVFISRLKVNKTVEASDCVCLEIDVQFCNLRDSRIFREKTVMKSERTGESYTTINFNLYSAPNIVSVIKT